jgi:hypothetical protein
MVALTIPLEMLRLDIEESKSNAVKKNNIVTGNVTRVLGVSRAKASKGGRINTTQQDERSISSPSRHDEHR